MSAHGSSARAVQRPSARGVQGFTLVELMVAMAIGLLLVAALVALVVSTIANRSELDKSARQIENGRYALKVLSEDIALAGFMGTSGLYSWDRVAPVACPASVADLGYATSTLPLAVQLLTATPGCVNNVQPGTDMLLLTRVAVQPVAPASTSATEAYVQVSTCQKDTKSFTAAAGAQAADFTLMQKDCSDTHLAQVRKAIQRIYFVSSCHECGKDTIPTLKVAEYVGGTMTITPLVEGIENLQFDFGIDTDGNGSPDCYVSNPDAPAPAQIDASVCVPPATAYDWSIVAANRANVMAVRVNLLARNTETTGGWTDDRTYHLGLGAPTVGPFNDSYKRHAYSTVARLNNPSGLRELP